MSARCFRVGINPTPTGIQYHRRGRLHVCPLFPGRDKPYPYIYTDYQLVYSSTCQLSYNFQKLDTNTMRLENSVHLLGRRNMEKGIQRGARRAFRHGSFSTTRCQLVGADFMSARCFRVGINPTPTNQKKLQ